MFVIHYDKITGQILRYVDVPEFAIESNLSTNENESSFVSECNISNDLFRIVDDEPILLPPKPDTNYTFDYEYLEWKIDYELTVEIVKATRQELLSSADILIFKAEDNGIDTAEFRNYRKALRDITKQDGYPFNVVFPEAPQFSISI